MDSFKIKKMIINKIIITTVFILVTIVMDAQELIQAGKYDDLMSAPEIATVSYTHLTLPTIYSV